MCLAIIAHLYQANWPLIIVANRDEFHARNAIAAAPWPDKPEILAGRDLQAGGTWLGINRKGNFALLTNHRDPARQDPDAPSRGQIAETFLSSEFDAQTYAKSLQDQSGRFNGFNLLIGDHQSLLYVSNRSAKSPLSLQPGIYGVSNALLDTPWPKLIDTRASIAEHLSSHQAPDPEVLLQIMQNRKIQPDEALAQTGVGIERERLLSSPFILNEKYGTRCTTVIMKRADEVIFFYEYSYLPSGELTGIEQWKIDTSQASITRLHPIMTA